MINLKIETIFAIQSVRTAVMVVHILTRIKED